MIHSPFSHIFGVAAREPGLCSLSFDRQLPHRQCLQGPSCGAGPGGGSAAERLVADWWENAAEFIANFSSPQLNGIH